MNCLDCRKCCTLTKLPPGKYPNPSDPWWVNLPEEHKAEMVAAIATYGVRGIGLVLEPCIYLDGENGCKLFPNYVPEYCQQFPTGVIEEAICGLFALSKTDPSITSSQLMAQMSITEAEAAAWLAENGGASDG